MNNINLCTYSKIMEATELRIGNYIQYFKDIVVCTGVENKHPDYISAVQKEGACTYYNEEDSFTPIILTEEWLEKFRFKKQHRSEWRWKNILVVRIWRGSLYVKFKRYDIATFKHVHQLQNLYYALTNEELTIK